MKRTHRQKSNELFSEFFRGRRHFFHLDEVDQTFGGDAMTAVQLSERWTLDQLQTSRHFLQVRQRLVDQTLAHIRNGKVELETNKSATSKG